MEDRVLVLKEDFDPLLCLGQIVENLQPAKKSEEIKDPPV
jgi:hypothetical protein